MEKNESFFFPGLNGIRAIAALTVVVSHITVSLADFQLNPHILGTYPNGNPRGTDLSDFSVTLFFALSGFLITYLLLVESGQSGINIKNFYIRRILRIWPLYYLYFLVATAANFYWDVPHHHPTSLFYVFFAANVPKILQVESTLLGHYWSLGVEEQFYIFWPLLVKLAGKKLRTITIGLIGALVGMKLIAHLIFPDTLFESSMYVNRLDCVLIGALGAQVYHRNQAWLIGSFTHPLLQAGGWAVLALAAANRFHVASVLDHEIMSGVAVILIFGQIARRGLVSLDKKMFDFLGTISYGIYVLHPLVIFGARFFRSSLTFLPAGMRYVLIYASITGLTIGLAHLSYKYFERPFLRLKRKFSSAKPLKAEAMLAQGSRSANL